MAITKTSKTFQEVEVQITPFLKVSEIMSPHEEWEVVPFLPVSFGRREKVNDEFFVIEGGRVVAPTAVDSSDRFTDKITLANGGADRTIVYGTDDINRTEDIDNPNNLVSSAGTATAKDTANIPIGIAPYPYYQGTLKDRLRNFELQPFVAVWNTAYCEYPVQFDEQDTGATALDDGVLLESGDEGQLQKWQDGVDSVEQIVGRCWRLNQISKVYPRGGLDKVHTFRGSSLSGTDTAGIPAHLTVTHKDDGTPVVLFFRAVINAAP